MKRQNGNQSAFHFGLLRTDSPKFNIATRCVVRPTGKGQEHSPSFPIIPHFGAGLRAQIHGRDEG
jgi:hypothetical protein